jgi:hypothetical protein
MPTAATVKATALLALVAGFALAAFPLRADEIPVDNFGFIRVNSYFSRLGQGDVFGQDNLWYVSSGTVDLITGYWNSPDGDPYHSVDLDGTTAGAIATTLDVANPGPVTITFDLAGNPDGPPLVKGLLVQLGTAVPETDNEFQFALPGGYDWNHADMGWTPASVVFDVPVAGSYTLSFASLDDNSDAAYGPVVADVAAYQIPDSGSCLVFLILGIGGLACLRRRPAVAVQPPRIGVR